MVKLLLLVGWLWPFVVAIAGVATISAGWELRSDFAIDSLCFSALLGSPAVVITIARWLPASELRGVLAVTLAVPVVVLELCLAIMILAYGAYPAGWIE